MIGDFTSAFAQYFPTAAGDPYQVYDVRIVAGSPAIDAGDNSSVPALITTDLDGQPRFVDDPATRDTGLGEPPVVDIGCFEFQAFAVADLNQDGVVNIYDLLLVISNWGPCGDPENCPADIAPGAGDGVVNVIDLLSLISQWG
ncbi:MAG: hypothetical protein L0Y44_07810 [Phycisphaerales bacterium]|nr:hypothetical protein [Phycisphaerales bacterium]MCI0676828.1 hypothetical protein [Phycisphaerales bacterium]